MGDRANFLADQIIRSFRPLRDAFVAIGILYSMKSVIKIGYQILLGTKTFGLSKLRWPNLVRQYGDWAIITGCTQGIGRAYAEELAKMKMNLLLVSRNEEKLSILSNELEEKYKIKTEIAQIDFAKPCKGISNVIEDKIKDKDIGLLVNN